MTVKLQVPIESAVRDALEQRARSLGFDSAQAYIRVWAKAEAEGRTLDFDSKPVTLSPEADARYQRLVAELETQKMTSNEVFHTVDEFMQDLKV
ncbi:MAG: hypothetical protein QFB87_02095 [Patescibacteria group bacterium]|nr:hypothetical protein [Patescibacteria group bacterium]